MSPLISFGYFVIPAYPFLSLIGLWAGMWLAARLAEQAGIDGDHIYNLGLYGLVAGLLGGRLAYVIGHWESYDGELLQALALTANAIDPVYAVLFGLLAAAIYISRQHLAWRTVADVVAPGAAFALAIGGVGAFLGSQRLGAITEVPWGLSVYGQLRHPAHLYQVVAMVIILVLLWWLRSQPRWPGFTCLLFLELYAGSRLLLEPFFADPLTLDFGLRTVQVVALAAMIIILLLMMRLEQADLIANQNS